MQQYNQQNLLFWNLLLNLFKSKTKKQNIVKYKYILKF